MLASLSEDEANATHQLVSSLRASLLAQECSQAEVHLELRECTTELECARAELRENSAGSLMTHLAKKSPHGETSSAPGFSKLRGQLQMDIQKCRDDMRQHMEASEIANRDADELQGLRQQLASDIAIVRGRLASRRKLPGRRFVDETTAEPIQQPAPPTDNLPQCGRDPQPQSDTMSVVDRLEMEMHVAAGERQRLRLESDRLMLESEELLGAESGTCWDLDFRVEGLSDRRRAIATRDRRLSLALLEVDEALRHAPHHASMASNTTCIAGIAKRVSFSSEIGEELT
jgi:hypothetical protein